MKMKKIAIIGASGYSGEVLVQLLLNHPHAELVAVTSRQNAGQTLAQVFKNSPAIQNPKRFGSANQTPKFWRKKPMWFFSRCRTASPPNTPCRCLPPALS
jgi:N-acetyl-gamma-glutamylphosphate reductase